MGIVGRERAGRHSSNLRGGRASRPCTPARLCRGPCCPRRQQGLRGAGPQAAAGGAGSRRCGSRSSRALPAGGSCSRAISRHSSSSSKGPQCRMQTPCRRRAPARQQAVGQAAGVASSMWMWIYSQLTCTARRLMLPPRRAGRGQGPGAACRPSSRRSSSSCCPRRLRRCRRAAWEPCWGPRAGAGATRWPPCSMRREALEGQGRGARRSATACMGQVNSAARYVLPHGRGAAQRSAACAAAGA